MKKIYWQSEIKNFGDELNSDFYEKALKTDLNKFKENESILGIGSILDYDTSKHSKIHVLGTGSGYEKINNKNKTKITQSKILLCVTLIFFKSFFTSKLGLSSQLP